ncbi:lipid II flippase MurJ, partial [Klebsiella pneumoniae]|uniref:lipid II flippase MurJ n=1 Tax=Klebsiella pneumoniae TaxID=573 RepID=UPI003EDEEAD0
AALFQQGKFHSSDTAITADCLRIFSIGIGAWCLHPILMRSFFAMQSSVVPIVIGTITTFIFVGLIVAFQQTTLGYLGLPLAGSLSAIIL